MKRRKLRDAPSDLPETNYYVLKCFRRDYGATLSEVPRLSPPLDNWFGGFPWTMEVPAPLVFKINEDDEGEMLPFFPTFPLMSDDLIAALETCGVTNLAYYSAIIEETRTGNTYVDYKAVNVIGVVSAVDEEKSDAVDVGFGSTRFFHKLSLDEKKAHGLLLFRLKESVSNIVIHKTVRDYLIDKGFSRLVFVHPDQFSG